jgi:hypothetical protein
MKICSKVTKNREEFVKVKSVVHQGSSKWDNSLKNITPFLDENFISIFKGRKS